MKNIQMKHFLVVLILGICITNALSQFEQKFTINFSAGTIYPFGEADWVRIRDMSDQGMNTDLAYIYPYIMSNFDPGILLTGGIQYNINRRFSIAADIAYFNLWNWTYQVYAVWANTDEVLLDEPWLYWEITQDDIDGYGDETIVRTGNDKYNLFNLSLGVTPKVYFNPGSKFNPFLFTGVTANYTSLNYINNQDKAEKELGITSEGDFNPLEEMMDKSIGFGFFPGVGFDIQINENIGMFLQGGYLLILLDKEEMEDNYLEPENFQTIRGEAGIKISFLKSKDF